MSSHPDPDAAKTAADAVVDPPAPSAPSDPAALTTPHTHVALTQAPLSPTAILAFLSSPSAGANVLFAGTTRATAGALTVTHLSYSAYVPLALRTMQRVAADARAAHGLERVALVHRLGAVPVGESSVLVGVSSGHRAEAWRGAEEVLERCKERVEVWKREEFEGGAGEWRANAEGRAGGGGGGEAEGERGGDGDAADEVVAVDGAGERDGAALKDVGGDSGFESETRQ